MAYLDIPETHEDYDATAFVTDIYLVSGYPDGKFHSERTVTWAEMAKIIFTFVERHMDSSDYINRRPFDMDHAAWAAGFVTYCLEENFFDAEYIKKIDLNDAIRFEDLYDIFGRIKEHKLHLLVLKQGFRRFTGVATRSDIAHFIYGICKKTGPEITKELVELHKGCKWEQSIELLSRYDSCVQFVDSDIAYIFNQLEKIKERKPLHYEHMIRILNCKQQLSYEKEDQIIYHYTTLHALENLTQADAKFRLYNTAYLNDPMEGNLLLPHIKSRFEEEENEVSDWNFLKTQYNEISIRNSFIASFVSCEDELLPMWIQYGDNAGGCMLGIRADSIQAPLYKMFYDADLIDKFIDEIKSMLLSYKQKNGEIDLNQDIVFSYAADTFTQVSYLYKSKFYEHEHEVRILQFADLPFAKTEQTIRLGEYFNRLFVELNNPLQIDSITLGPKAIGPEKIAVALSGRECENIKKSCIQYR